MLQYFIIMVGLIAKMQRYDFFCKGEIKSEKYNPFINISQINFIKPSASVF